MDSNGQPQRKDKNKTKRSIFDLRGPRWIHLRYQALSRTTILKCNEDLGLAGRSSKIEKDLGTDHFLVVL